LNLTGSSHDFSSEAAPMVPQPAIAREPMRRAMPLEK
jgi:hypothetical protein